MVLFGVGYFPRQYKPGGKIHHRNDPPFLTAILLVGAPRASMPGALIVLAYSSTIFE